MRHGGWRDRSPSGRLAGGCSLDRSVCGNPRACALAEPLANVPNTLEFSVRGRQCFARWRGNIFTAGVVLSVMILPIITSVTREVFSLTPTGHIEAAQALGATKWEVMRMTVFPHGRSGMIAGAMLGLGRALGETVAVLIILRSAAGAGAWSLFDGGYVRLEDRLRGGGVQLSVAHRGLYRGRLCSLPVDVCRQRQPAGLRVEGPARDDPSRIAGQGPFPSGRFGPQVQGPAREVLFATSSLIALVPLVWVLYTVVRRVFRCHRVIHVVVAFACRCSARAVHRWGFTPYMDRWCSR